MHLVTGRAGNAHINSDMVGRFNAGVIGSDSYILKTQNELACTIEDANTVSIATGDAVIQGRNVTNEAPVTLSVQSGAQNVSRYDLVCVRYENNGGIETASLVIITGTPSATPVDPSYNDGSILDGALVVDIPIYRLIIDGVSIADVNKLVPTIGGFQDRLAKPVHVEAFEVTIPSIPHGQNSSAIYTNVAHVAHSPIGVMGYTIYTGTRNNWLHPFKIYVDEDSSELITQWHNAHPSEAAQGVCRVYVLIASLDFLD